MPIQRLQTKITLTYVVLTVVTVTSLAILAGIATKRYLVDRKIDELEERITALAELLPTETDQTLAALHRSVVRFARATGLRITLIDSAGTVLIDSDVPIDHTSSIENHLSRPEVQDAVRGRIGVATRRSATVHGELLYVARRMRLAGATGVLAGVRVVRVSAHLTDVDSMAAKEQLAIILSGVVVLGVVIAVSVVLSRRIARPMVTIADAVERIRAGELDTHITVRGNDEVARVARAVNEMVDKLKADIVRLKKLERVRTEFFGNVSHELRTPIFSLQGFLETLMEGAVDDPQVNRTFLKKAYEHSVRLNSLLEDLMTISHIESGEMKMSFRYFDLHEFLTALMEEYRTSAERNNVTLRLVPSSSDAVEVLGDRERLRVVFENLLENAIKYNRPDGEVSVSYTLQDGFVRIAVADTGVGIAAEHLPRIFERFYRVDKNRSREVGGTGLGLAIAKHIVEAHGSTLHVESTPGKGSTFWFTLRS